jgi:signal transduction histidine kinase
MGSELGVRDQIGRWILRRRWLAMLLLGLAIATFELLEHISTGDTSTDFGNVQEIAALSILIPIVIGWTLSTVARMRSEATVIRITTIESERTRLARDLHDTVGQNLAYMRLKLERLSSEEPTPDVAQLKHELRQLSDLMDTTCELVRGKLVELRPPASPELATALLDYARIVGRRAHFAVEFHNRGQSRHLPERTQREVVYLFREALVNIEKHANAQCVRIELTWLADGLSLSLVDDGEGFDPEAIASNGHFGLEIMRERVEEINGRLSLRSQRHFGTELMLWLPLEASQSVPG